MGKDDQTMLHNVGCSRKVVTSAQDSSNVQDQTKIVAITRKRPISREAVKKFSNTQKNLDYVSPIFREPFSSVI